MRPKSIRTLPSAIPVFPLTGALLLPFGTLPLNIFEPRYLAMTRAALAGDWLIGMVQPSDADDPADNPALYDIGCAGRITSLSETDDGRYLITLKGLCRFRILEELPIKDGFRSVRVDWSSFANDFAVPDRDSVDRARLVPALRRYLDATQIAADWSSIEQAPSDQLVTSLAMMCPFEPAEKQALLECPHLAERAELMISLFAMAVLDKGDAPSQTHH